MTPANPSVAKGLTQQFTATGTYYRQLDAEPDQPGDLGLGESPRSPRSPRTGLASTAGHRAPSTITATLGGVSSTTALTVTPAVAESIAVTPANPSVAKGLTEQFTATGTFSDSSTQDLTSQVTWASATPAVATITSDRPGVDVAHGSSTITATDGAVSGSDHADGQRRGPASIAVTPANPSIAKGLTEQFTATGTFSDSSTQDLTSQVTWASASPPWRRSPAAAWPPTSPRARRRSPPARVA